MFRKALAQMAGLALALTIVTPTGTVAADDAVVFATTGVICDNVTPGARPQFEWAINNGTDSVVHATLYIDGAPSRHMTVQPHTSQARFKRFEHRHWVMVTADGVVLFAKRVTACRINR